MDLVPAGLERISGSAIGWVEEVDVSDGGGAVVHASFSGKDTSGSPAVTRRSHGTGSAWYVATNPDAPGRYELLSALLAEAAVVPVLGQQVPGVEAVKRGSTLFLLNHGDTDAVVPGVGGTVLDDGGGALLQGGVLVNARVGLHLGGVLLRAPICPAGSSAFPLCATGRGHKCLGNKVMVRKINYWMQQHLAPPRTAGQARREYVFAHEQVPHSTCRSLSSCIHPIQRCISQVADHRCTEASLWRHGCDFKNIPNIFIRPCNIWH